MSGLFSNKASKSTSIPIPIGPPNADCPAMNSISAPIIARNRNLIGSSVFDRLPLIQNILVNGLMRGHQGRKQPSHFKSANGDLLRLWLRGNRR